MKNDKLAVPRSVTKLLPKWARLNRKDVFVTKMPVRDLVDVWMVSRRGFGFFAVADGFVGRGDTREEALARVVQQVYATMGEDLTVFAGETVIEARNPQMNAASANGVHSHRHPGDDRSGANLSAESL